jgi:hypothetical protein
MEDKRKYVLNLNEHDIIVDKKRSISFSIYLKLCTEAYPEANPFILSLYLESSITARLDCVLLLPKLMWI